MNMEQKKTLIDMAVPYINKRAKVFFGTACDSMEETVELSNYAPGGSGRRDADQPYYFTIDDASIEAFYDEAANKINGPLYIYNFPARTGYDVKPEIVLNLLRSTKISWD